MTRDSSVSFPEYHGSNMPQEPWEGLSGHPDGDEEPERCDNCGGLVDDQGCTVDLYGCCTYCKAD